MASATNGVFSASYTYNARGERVIKIVDGIETHFIFDLSGKLITEADANGNILREYVYFNDAPLAQIVDSDIYYYHNSHLGTPESMTDSAQAVVWSSSYTPFGMGSITTGVVENNLRFPGQYYDAETGLHYNYFRYYDPSTGRYITSDPIGLEGGINTYSYALNNPLYWIDPDGLNAAVGVGVSVGLCARFPRACGAAAGTVICAITGMCNESQDDAADEISSQCPTGSKPINETDWSGDHQDIKAGIGAGPADSTKIDPSGNVWGENPDGSWTNYGPAGDYTGSGVPSGRKGKDRRRRY